MLRISKKEDQNVELAFLDSLMIFLDILYKLQKLYLHLSYRSSVWIVVATVVTVVDVAVVVVVVDGDDLHDQLHHGWEAVGHYQEVEKLNLLLHL